MNYRVGEKIVSLINLQDDHDIRVGDVGVVTEPDVVNCAPYDLSVLFPGRGEIYMRRDEVAPVTSLHKFLFGLDTDQQAEYTANKEIEK